MKENNKYKSNSTKNLKDDKNDFYDHKYINPRVNNFFEEDRYVKIYNICNINKTSNSNEKVSENDEHIKKDIKNNLNNNYTNFVNIHNQEKNKEVLDNSSKNITDSDLQYVIDNSLKPNNDSMNNEIKTSNNIQNNNINNIQKNNNNHEQYEDFNLKDALDDNINDGNKNVKNNCNVNNIDSDLNIKKTNDGKHLSLKYLGLGYDIIIGNPEGEPGLNIDPGFKGPILNLNINNIDNTSTITNNTTTTTNNNNNITPWVIPEHSCNQSKNVDMIKNLEQYKYELSEDVSISTPMVIPYSFSGSVEFRNAVNKLKLQNNVIFMMKIYCLRYFTGITINTNWIFNEHFKKVFNNLPNTFDGLKEDSKCTYVDYKNKMDSAECEKNVNKWILFFRLFGTHITHELYLGGKIIFKMIIDKEEYNKIKNKNINIKSAFLFYFSKMGLSLHDVKNSKNIFSKFQINKNISILGGNPGLNLESPNFFEKWVTSIEHNSMPIKTKLIPFSYFMNDPEKIKAYKDALTFYGLSHGIRIIDQEKYNNYVLTIGSYLSNCEQILYAGPSPGLLTCPIGSSIVMGFSLNLDFISSQKLNNKYGMLGCDQLRESCSGTSLNTKYGDTRIWALCSSNPMEFITQIVEQGEGPKLTASCPDGLVILFGFALMKGRGFSSANNIDIYPCRTGQKSCSAVLQKRKLKESMIYITCVDHTTEGLEQIQTFSQIENMKGLFFRNSDSLKFNCPEHSHLIFGFSIEFHTNFPKTRNNFIHCSKESNTCLINASKINTNLLFFKKDKYSLANISVCKFENKKSIIT